MLLSAFLLLEFNVYKYQKNGSDALKRNIGIAGEGTACYTPI